MWQYARQPYDFVRRYCGKKCALVVAWIYFRYGYFNDTLLLAQKWKILITNQFVGDPRLPSTVDVLVLGGGVMGLSAGWAASKLKRKDGSPVSFVVVEKSDSTITSSWGESRILRLAYADEMKIRMMQRSYALWSALEGIVKEELMQPSPTLTIYHDTTMHLLKNLTTAYNTLGITYRELSPREVKKEYPMVRLKRSEMHQSELNSFILPGDVAIEQTDGACIFATEAVEALKTAVGDDNIAEDKAVSVDVHNRTVTFASGKIVKYGSLILACGSWTNQLLHNSYLGLMNYITTAEQFTYYEPKKAEDLPLHETSKMPIIISIIAANFCREPIRSALHNRPHFPDMELGIYCLPALRGGIGAVKVGQHQDGQIIRSLQHILPFKVQLPKLPVSRSSETIKEVPVEKDPYLESATNGFIQQYLPGLDGTHACSYGRCLYQLSCMKDYDFIIGAHWDAPDGRVQVATGFSGEGFKFAPVIGEFLATQAVRALDDEGALPPPNRLFREMKARFDPSRDLAGEDCQASSSSSSSSYAEIPLSDIIDIILLEWRFADNFRGENDGRPPEAKRMRTGESQQQQPCHGQSMVMTVTQLLSTKGSSLVQFIEEKMEGYCRRGLLGDGLCMGDATHCALWEWRLRDDSFSSPTAATASSAKGDEGPAEATRPTGADDDTELKRSQIDEEASASTESALQASESSLDDDNSVLNSESGASGLLKVGSKWAEEEVRELLRAHSIHGADFKSALDSGHFRFSKGRTALSLKRKFYRLENTT
ncbi:hypothetical protein FOZ63_002404 [Perkinsus olseni]|uniref:FAD dependent oxidoreductase domain-containing protein n=1 Tax=Perkinsus olseni TaxID=32597 RepID=A0A7J6TK64_PEROL|nr:hypothetical protein FOZ63_002404 [Perkinsus olseni]